MPAPAHRGAGAPPYVAVEKTMRLMGCAMSALDRVEEWGGAYHYRGLIEVGRDATCDPMK